MIEMKRFTFWLYLLLSVSIILAGCGEIYQNKWASFGMSLLTLIFMSLPFFIEKRL
ncbi:hypothetical protein [Desulfitobacterium sp.]|uniref:hypothetical protein n=1 Tax=Desulfitobacterium sp. TaxID=49981 RepID=UPI002CA05E93|nr:hypothetical protein [Desulfitobacterium sp.]HVJ48945.1 hypothetical protein [Desulfitobacterium sp.]